MWRDMGEPGSCSARAALREATSAQHQRLHELNAFAELAAGRIGRSGYVALLKRLYGFHRPTEHAVAAGLGAEDFGLDTARWRRADLLARDLAWLGTADADLEAVALLDIARPPASPAEAMGWLYVIEGSTLGGRLLSRQLDSILHKNHTSGRLFLLAGGDPQHTSWREFCGAVERCGSDPNRRLAMLSGAREAFDRFEGWFVKGCDAVTA
jgi:heme oxygenase